MEAPTSYLSYICPLGDFEWVLTNVALDNKEYLDYYKRRSEEGRVIVVDSGVNEEGKPRSIEEMDEIIQEVNADFIVPPDILGNREETLSLLDMSIDQWGKDKLVPVIQGKDVDDVRKCVKSMVERGFTNLCVPYDIAMSRESTLGHLANTRFRVVALIQRVFPEVRSLHLLGLTLLDEIAMYSWKGWKISSIDTGSPVLNAFCGNRFGLGDLIPKGKYIDYTEKFSEDTGKDRLFLSYWNISYLRKVMASGSLDGAQIFAKEKFKYAVR